jgi:hypothetical protein
MKTCSQKYLKASVLLRLFLAGLCLAAPARIHAGVGSWLPLANTPPGAGIGHMILLSDGTVMAQQSTGFPNYGASNWWRLTPDQYGSYRNGQWTKLSSMNNTREYYSSDVLQDGRVLVAGGEYGSGYDKAEVYDPVADHWTPITVPAGLITTTTNVTTNGVHFYGFADSLSVILNNGKVLITPVTPVTPGTTVLFDPVANTFSAGPLLPDSDSSADEQSCVKLPDDSILSFDQSQNGQRYIPSLNVWIDDKSLPVQLFDVNDGEVGAGFLLPDGRAFFLGGSGLCLYYTPTGNTNKGAWGPVTNIPNGLVTEDAPAAMMSNGKILCAVTIATNHSTNYFFEFDPVAGTFQQTSGPNSAQTDTNYVISDATSMLDLPDGTVLYSDTGGQLYNYFPGSGQLPAGKPVITSVTFNSDGSLHLTGTLFNGISQGASFGDDNQMDSNYPLIRFTDGSSHVFYGHTYNWSSTSVQTGSKIVTTECTVPANIYNGPGTYSIQVVANGIASDAVTFNGPVWVDFNYTGSTQNGAFPTPYKTIAQGTNAVVSGGIVALNASVQPSASSATLTISKPMTIISVYGPSTIGN